MHLLILHQAMVFGGAERTTCNLLTMLDRSVVQRITFAAPDALRDLMPVAYDSHVNTADLIRHGWFASPESFDQDVEATAQLLREANADIALGMMHYSAALVVLAATNAGLGTKTIASFRGPLSEHIRRYEYGEERIAFLRQKVTRTAHLADRILVPSEGTADDTCTHFGAPRERTLVISNGIDAAAVRSASLAPAPGLEPLDDALPCFALPRDYPSKKSWSC
jgi:glycosyltransferase involved in cell wall biosynthesis